MNTESNVEPTTSAPEVFFHVSREAHSPGDIKPVGTYWQTLVADGMNPANDPLGEFLREQIRATYYPDKPSRARSSYVFETFRDAALFRDFRNSQQPSAPPAQIYQVRFVDPAATRHRVTWSSFNMDSGIPAANQAHDFWKGGFLYSSDIEVFAESDLEFL